MKKRIWVPISLAVIMLLGLYLTVSLHRAHLLPQSDVEISGTAVDNRYRNFISEFDLVNDTGDLVRIGDKLYFNYYGSYASYGLYEIGAKGARRIHWDGYGPGAFLTGDGVKLYPIQEYEGKLLMNTIVDGNYFVYNREIREWEQVQGRIQTYSDEAQSFEGAELFGDVPGIRALNYQETTFGYVYESAKQSDLWVYTREDGSVQVAGEDVCAFYAVGEQIYYLTLRTAQDPFVLRVFNWTEKTDAVVCEWAEFTALSYFMIEGDTLVFVASERERNTQALYAMDLSNPEYSVDVLYEIDRKDPDAAYIYSWNVWNGTAYLCTDRGLVACELGTAEHRTLCEVDVLECDIVDDYWVYFLEDESHRLWRIKQTGGDAELVLG